MQYENEKIEYKSQMLEGIYKEVVAFANSDGGTIYVGIDDQGNLTGIDNVDETYTRLTNGIRDAIQPDVTIFVRYILQENKVIRIEVGEGSYKPYYLKAKGLKPSGVYVRQGASSVQASTEKIRQMIKEADGDIFESMRSIDQNLTFTATQSVFQRHQLEFTEKKFLSLGIRESGSKQFTNLALLLSDQFQQTIKIGVFSDDENTAFTNNKEFGGSLLQQADEAYAFLLMYNQLGSSFQGLSRIDRYDYPEEALREGFINALLHRDYSQASSVIINVNPKQIEFLSYGGLVGGLSVEDIRNGFSLSRNPALVDIFRRLKFVEAYGTGLRRIFKLYEKHQTQPQIIVSDKVFKLVLPNMNTEMGKVKEVIEPYGGTGLPREKHQTVNKTYKYAKITGQERMVLDYFLDHGEITEEELMEYLNVKKTRAYIVARQMVAKGLLEIVGRGKGKRYRLTK